MSENSITVVGLSLDEASARVCASAVREWLVTLGIVQVNATRHDLWQPSEFRAGPNVQRAVAEWGTDEAKRANSGVELVLGRELHHPVENFEPPSCPGCSTALVMDDDRHASLVEEWLGGEEPSVGCAKCGRTALLGDWPGEWMFAVGNLAVRFNNWPPLRAEFVEALRKHLGARTRVVYTHT